MMAEFLKGKERGVSKKTDSVNNVHTKKRNRRHFPVVLNVFETIEGGVRRCSSIGPPMMC